MGVTVTKEQDGIVVWSDGYAANQRTESLAEKIFQEVVLDSMGELYKRLDDEKIVFYLDECLKWNLEQGEK